MAIEFQISLPLVQYELEQEVIHQRVRDGYINATAMCKAAGRPWGRYWETAQAKEFAVELSSDIGIPISELIQSVRGGDPSLQGTWVHPQVAVNLAQWLSPKFAVRVSRWVSDWQGYEHGANALRAFDKAVAENQRERQDMGVWASPLPWEAKISRRAGHLCP